MQKSGLGHELLGRLPDLALRVVQSDPNLQGFYRPFEKNPNLSFLEAKQKGFSRDKRDVLVEVIRAQYKDLKDIPTAEIEKKLQELRTKYLKARNPEIQKQLNFFIIDFQEELKMRWYKEQQELQKNSGKDLDNLINVE